MLADDARERPAHTIDPPEKKERPHNPSDVDAPQERTDDEANGSKTTHRQE